MSRMTCSKDGMSTERILWASTSLRQNLAKYPATRCSLPRYLHYQFSSRDWHNNCSTLICEFHHFDALEWIRILSSHLRAFGEQMISLQCRLADSFGPARQAAGFLPQLIDGYGRFRSFGKLRSLRSSRSSWSDLSFIDAKLSGDDRNKQLGCDRLDESAAKAKEVTPVTEWKR